MKDRPDFPVPVILDRIYKLVDDPSTDSIISWSKSNKGFVIRNQEKLIRRKIYKRFFCSSFKTFISRLKHYGYSKIKSSDGLREFGNENFVRGQPMLMKEMHIKTVMKRLVRSPLSNARIECPCPSVNPNTTPSIPLTTAIVVFNTCSTGIICISDVTSPLASFLTAPAVREITILSK
ncbi:hypothetical protein EUTSA_v10012073mg [Eutrema salsugineum]|uniref:HSF-type DNA-binding domain-containing protein n=1 Tax=Eutrema salsugineum TaxID=72664 RepID=V4KLB3_EUTSA|nr:hypothetical protein EUTSA_v10012073mg [Eutrema salsugineum]